MSCGSNNYGQLGRGDTQDSSSPILVSTLENIISISTAYHSSFALAENGSFWSWGRNQYGQLCRGDLTERYLPEEIQGFKFVSLVGARHHVIGISPDSVIYVCGSNEFGQLGLGNVSHQLSFVPLLNLPSYPLLLHSTSLSMAPSTVILMRKETQIQEETKKENSSMIAILVLVILVFLVLLISVFVLFILKQRRKKEEHMIHQISLQELPRSSNLQVIENVKIKKRIGGGNYGDVYLGKWNDVKGTKTKLFHS